MSESFSEAGPMPNGLDSERSQATPLGPVTPDRARPHRQVTLDEVRDEIGDCHRCPLGETRTKLVFGVGDPHARVMFIGEAPGKNEDLQGEPFVGAAGHKLDALLSEAGLTRDQVFIANILKCRPPRNRDPRPDEIQVCTPFLRDQVRAVWPDVIVTLGKFATQFVLRTDRGITGLRGRVYKTGHFLVLPIFHPAAAIYDPSKMETLHQDFATLGRLLDELGEPGEASQAAAARVGNDEGTDDEGADS